MMSYVFTYLVTLSLMHTTDRTLTYEIKYKSIKNKLALISRNIVFWVLMY